MTDNSNRNNPYAHSRHKDSRCPGAIVGEPYSPMCCRVIDVAIDFRSEVTQTAGFLMGFLEDVFFDLSGDSRCEDA